IYELVINTNPSYAFLLEGNSVLQNKLVIAHVLGHTDFFKNNIWFGRTNRQMIEGVSVNADRIRKYEFEHGEREVEKFLDAVLVVQEHVDANQRLRQELEQEEPKRPQRSDDPYEDLFSLDERAALATPEPAKHRKLPEEPEKDLLLFLAEHSPELETWQRDVVHMVRSEMLYFVPQMQTKIMNEGWASLFHSRIMRELDLSDDEYTAFAQMHSGVLSPSRRRVNPYYVGLKMLEDIERRWNEPTEEERRLFGRQGGEGLKKLFEVREIENDVSFLRNYLTPELVDDLDLYVYRLEGNEWKIVEKHWEKVRDALVASMTNFGQPYIVVEDGDYRRNRELYLRHCFEGEELDLDWAERTLRYVFQLWGRPVHLETVSEGAKLVVSYDGGDATRKRG
ncbi:MAG: SpoVR family protein, partial [Chloroflexi bacterium]|nr:SpoVR family protein [Chloroflexota bacterium]